MKQSSPEMFQRESGYQGFFNKFLALSKTLQRLGREPSHFRVATLGGFV